MKNPLRKRIPHELKQSAGIYFVIFAFLVLLIGLVSGFLVASDSMMIAYDEGIEKYAVENGHIAFDKILPEDLKEQFESEGDVKLYELFYKNITDANDKHVRIYKNREDINIACVMEGKLPEKSDEIAIDRLFAENNKISVGDTMKMGGKTLTISGFVALPDYSCLYEDSSDMMFNATNFTIAVMTEEGFASFDKVVTNYNYAWKYNQDIDRKNDKLNKDRADELLEKGQDILVAYDLELAKAGNIDDVIFVNDYLPQYMNQAINFAREDIGGDSAMFLVFSYLVVIIICFVFAVTISNTIQEEAGVIGTLRASGYTKAELVVHYMTLPVIVTIVGALVGNILGYSILKNVMAQLYYHSYSLSKFNTLWNADAFVKTTVVPIVMMFVINIFVLTKKLKLSPIRFLRHDISKRGKKKAFRLNTKIPFMNRFRLRVLFQNIPNYITLFFGIFIGGVIVVFCLMFKPMLADYKELVLEQRISDYQYILVDTAYQTKNAQAEEYCLETLKTTKEKFVVDEVSVFGITEGSKYITADVSDDKIAVSSAFAKKYMLSEGDTVELKDSFADVMYEFEISSIYEYDAGIAVFMNRDSFNKTFMRQDGYFTGYFSNEELDDIPEEKIAKIITLSDLTKVSDQLTDSMGGFTNILMYFGVIMFLLLMYLLSKQIIEKNAKSISMSKILGFYNSEIGSIYIVATSLVVFLALFVTCPLTDLALRLIFENYLYTMLSGYVPYNLSSSCFVKMFALGAGCYAVIAALQMIRIGKVNKADALKNVE